MNALDSRAPGLACETWERLGGSGEIGLISIAPAVGNAYFAATGTRLHQLPPGA